MQFDGRNVPSGKTFETDVCIIGAGAAGIAIAREFIGQPFRVTLIESGGFEYAEDTQSLYKGNNVGLPYYPLDTCRLRYFGGTTNHWSGWCRPLDPLDFEKRDWIPDSGWPFSKSVMDPFYKRAQFLCEIGPYLYEPQSWTTENTPPLPFDPNNVVSLIAQHSPPTLFGEVYREQILKAENIKTFLFSNVVEIDLDKSGKRVTGVKIACLTGNKFFLKSGLVILSTGGLENPRILLLSNSVQKSGIGNQNDIVGRYFMEHIFVTKSARVLTQKSNISLEFYKEHVVNNIMLVAGISISPKNQNKEKLVNFGTRIEKIKKDTDTPKDKSIHSFDHLIQFLRRGDIPSNFLEHLGNIIADIDDVAVHAYRKIFPPNDVWEISYHAEQAPNPSSRVTLIREKDALGKNKIQLDWRLLDLDKYSIQRAHELLGMELGRAGLGRIEIIYDEEDFPGGNHHIGTTRLHNNPQKGVVDMNCKVHGVSNLFIAGSSVFPTSGCSPPTLTIVALALRLGDHVKNIMTKTGAP